MRVISVEISPETAAGGFILLNAHVDVIRSHRDKMAEKSAGFDAIPARTFCTTCALYNVRGLAIDQTVEEKNGQRVVVGKTATELVPHQQRRSRFRVFVGSVELIRCLTCLG
jgi:pilus assembly protein CpaB